MRKENPSAKIQWHPGFWGAAELELRDNKGDLDFLREYPLSKRPIVMDFLIIRKNPKAEIKNEIGKIFRTHNIFEYKNPKDTLGIDVFFKAIAYASLYKASGDTEDEIPANEITLSLLRSSFPRKLIWKLKQLGAVVDEHGSGIFYVKGVSPFPTQIIVTSKLDPASHSALRVLSDKVSREDMIRFLSTASTFTAKDDKINADAVLQVAGSANYSLLLAIKEDRKMCDVLKELFKDELEAEQVKSAKAVQELQEATLARENLILSSVQNIAKKYDISLREVLDSMQITDEERTRYAAILKI